MGTTNSPADLGGVPQSMATNSWWNGVGAAVGAGLNAATSLANNYVQLREAKAIIASAGVPNQNRPLGTFGLNPQASSVPGATPQGVGFAGLSPSMLMVGALGLVLLVYWARN